MSGLDTTLEADGFTHVRYADDFVVLVAGEGEARRALDYVRRFLDTRLRLRFKPSKTEMTPTAAGFTFVGYRFTRTEWTLPSESVARFRDEMNALLREPESGLSSPRQRGRTAFAAQPGAAAPRAVATPPVGSLAHPLAPHSRDRHSPAARPGSAAIIRPVPHVMVNTLVLYEIPHRRARQRFETLLRAHGFVWLFPHARWSSRALREHHALVRSARQRLKNEPYRLLFIDIDARHRAGATWIAASFR